MRVSVNEEAAAAAAAVIVVIGVIEMKRGQRWFQCGRWLQQCIVKIVDISAQWQVVTAVWLVIGWRGWDVVIATRHWHCKHTANSAWETLSVCVEDMLQAAGIPSPGNTHVSKCVDCDVTTSSASSHGLINRFMLAANRCCYSVLVAIVDRCEKCLVT